MIKPTPLVTLSSNKWCLVAPVKSQPFVKKEKEKENDAMHIQKVQGVRLETFE